MCHILRFKHGVRKRKVKGHSPCTLTATFALIIVGWLGATDAGQPALRFDCGPTSQRTAPGFQSLSGKDLYASEKGYGWLKAWGLDSGGGDTKTEVYGSAIGAREHIDTRPEDNDVTFRADVADGVYEVTVWVGIEAPREGRLGICVAANGRTVLGPPGGGGWGIVTRRTLPAVVDEGVLLLNFYVVGKGGAARLSVLGLTVEPVVEPAKQEALRAGWLMSPLKSDKPREVVINGKAFTEVVGRHELPLGALTAAQRAQALLVFARANPGDILDTSIPRREELLEQLSAFAAPGEEQPLWFGIHALRDLDSVRVSCSALTCAAGVIPAEKIELFTQTTRPRSLSDRNDKMIMRVADLLDQYAPFDVPEGKSQPIYLRLSVPSESAPDIYTGAVTITPKGATGVSLPLALRVLPLNLQSPSNKVWHLFSDPTRWVSMGRAERETEVEDMARHGINSLSVAYPPLDAHYVERNGRIVDAGYGATGEVLQHAARVGMRGPVIIGGTSGILMRFCGWNVDHNGAASHAFAPGQEGRALRLEHTDNKARTGANQAIGALLSPDETVRFEIRYRKEGAGTAVAGVTFMKTHKRDAVKQGQIALTLKPASEWQTASAATQVPQDALYGRTSISYSGGPGTVLIDEVRLIREGQEINLIINPGFEREIEHPPTKATEWPKPFMRDFTAAIHSLGEAVKQLGLEPWIQGTDEANGSPRELNEMRGARLSGLPTFCNLNPNAVELMGKDLDVVCLYSAFLGTEQACHNLLDMYHRRNQKLFYIASGAYVGQEFDWMPNRSHVGLCFWKSNADGTATWTYQRPNEDPFNDLDGEYKDYCMVFPPRIPGGPPVPTLGWEGIREGWRDYRYVYTLEQAAAQAEKEGRTAAAGMGRTVLAFIRDAAPWFEEAGNGGYDNRSADRLRWLAAWATLELQAGKDVTPPSALPTGIKALEIRSVASKPAATFTPLLCPSVDLPPVLDGRLDDPCWSGAVSIEGLQNYLNPELPVSQKTEVFFRHDTTNFYIGVRCFESEMTGLKTAASERDGDVFSDDSIEIFIDTQNDEFHFFQLAFNAASTRFDQLCAGDNNAGANVFGATYSQQRVRDVGWNAEWRVATSRHADRWEAEVSIPFKTVGRESDLWGINICRNRRASEAETSAWRVGGFFHQPKLFGKLLLSGARSGGKAITKFELPTPRFGGATAVLALSAGPEAQGFAEVEDKDGKVCRSEGSVNAGVVSLPYRLNRDSRSLTLVVTEGNSVMHQLKMATEVPAPIVLTRTQKVISLEAPRGVFEATIQPSAQEWTLRRLQVMLSGPDGEVVSRVESTLSGDTCAVSLNLGGFPHGMYTLTFSLPGPEGTPLIEQRESVILVPPYLSLPSLVAHP
ncbi:MAG: sugar-binding protein [Kiritimatiellia bacterium]